MGAGPGPLLVPGGPIPTQDAPSHPAWLFSHCDFHGETQLNTTKNSQLQHPFPSPREMWVLPHSDAHASHSSMLQTLKFWGKQGKSIGRETQGRFQHHHSSLFIKIHPDDEAGWRSAPALLMPLYSGDTGAAPSADLWD